MREIVRRQVRLWKTATHAEWRRCFRADYRIEDPVGTGFRAMGRYEAEWANMHTSALRLDMEIFGLIVGGDEIVADLRAVTHLGTRGVGPDAVDAMRSTLSYTGIYSVDETGLLATNRTFADPVDDTLWRAFYPTLAPPSERPLPSRGPMQLAQAVEDHLYFWNTDRREAWRRRFREDARIEDPVGSGARLLEDGSAVWSAAHAQDRRILLGCHRKIVGGMEVLTHGVRTEERTGMSPRMTVQTELFGFDSDGWITSWRVFREEPESSRSA
ncbi:MAG: hypothetical protein R3F35_11745 [Myxococcota bacterium]